jgi:DNA-binding LytR/AlgR family response regulator
MSIFQILRRPFPHDTSWQRSLRIATGFGAFVTIFLLVFRPFGLNMTSTVQLVRGSIVFGLVTFSCIFGSNVLLHFLFPRMVSEQNWTTGKQIVNIGAVLVLIGFVNYLVTPLLFNVRLTWEDIIRYQGIALSVGIFPIIIFTLYAQNRLLNQYKREAAVIQKKLDEKKGHDKPATGSKATEQSDEEGNRSAVPVSPDQPPVQNDLIVFESDNQSEKKTIGAAELVYIEAASNYIKIYFTQKGTLTYSIVRMTMKSAAAAVAGHNVFFRCHRAYIVNLDKVETMEGNAQGYKLKLQGTEYLIPVSRNLNREFSDRLLEFRKTGEPE